MKTLSIIILSILMCIEVTQAHRYFVWTYESSTLPKGAFEIEPWFTFSGGRNHYYSSFTSRIEFELGVTDRLLTAFYLNAKHTAGAEVDSLDNITGISKSNSFSFSNEWKFNILNSSVKPVGLALYGEYSLSPDEIELEYKVILDKKTPKSIFALNLVGEHEFEFEFEQEENGEGEIETEKEIKFEAAAGYMYLFKPTLGLGVELINNNEIHEGDWENSALFAGPSLFYSRNNKNGTGFFTIFSVMPQLTNLGGEAEAGKLDLNGHERIQARILFGISF